MLGRVRALRHHSHHARAPLTRASVAARAPPPLSLPRPRRPTPRSPPASVDPAGGEYQWVEGGSQAHLTPEEAQQDAERVMWLAYSAYHLGEYKKALDSYQELIDGGSDDQMLHVYMGCCLERMGWYTEAEEKAAKGPACPLQNRLLFHLAHRLNDENKLMMHHQKLADTTLDQLSLASIHYLRNHFQACGGAQRARAPPEPPPPRP